MPKPKQPEYVKVGKWLHKFMCGVSSCYSCDFSREHWERLAKWHLREVRKVKATLKRYGRHIDGCPADVPVDECTCGFAEAVK